MSDSIHAMSTRLRLRTLLRRGVYLSGSRCAPYATLRGLGAAPPTPPWERKEISGRERLKSVVHGGGAYWDSRVGQVLGCSSVHAECRRGASVSRKCCSSQSSAVHTYGLFPTMTVPCPLLIYLRVTTSNRTQRFISHLSPPSPARSAHRRRVHPHLLLLPRASEETNKKTTVPCVQTPHRGS